jgi:hypothetical protein
LCRGIVVWTIGDRNRGPDQIIGGPIPPVNNDVAFGRTIRQGEHVLARRSGKHFDPGTGGGKQLGFPRCGATAAHNNGALAVEREKRRQSR